MPITVALAFAFQTNAGHADPAIDNYESDFLALLNEYRTSNGRQPLSLNLQLTAASDWYACDMATDNYWHHDHSDNETPLRYPPERAAAFGYSGGVGENIAGGFAAAQDVFTAWQGSPGHNANMLNSSYTVIGVARYYDPASDFRYYWVTDFGFGPSPGNPPTALSDCPNGIPATTQPGPTTPGVIPTPTATPTTTPSPSSSPTPSPTAPPTPSPTAPPTPSPTAPPTFPPIAWGDLNCDALLNYRDPMAILEAAAGVTVTPVSATCPQVGANAMVAGEVRKWGDINCSGAVNQKDTVDFLGYLAAFEVQSSDPECPDPRVGMSPPGTPVPTASPTPTATPLPTPGGIGAAGVFLSRLVCAGTPEYARIKNYGTAPVSLSGFRLWSDPTSQQDFDLAAIVPSIGAGQEIELRSGPGASADPANGIYVLTADELYRDGDASDYAYLVRPINSNVLAYCPAG